MPETIPLSLDEAIVIVKMFFTVESEGLETENDLQLVQRIVTFWPDEWARKKGNYGPYWTWGGVYIWGSYEKELRKYLNTEAKNQSESIEDKKKYR